MPQEASEKISCALPALLLGVLVTLAIQGYQFGHGNHAVYLLDAVRRSDPTFLTEDWFTTQTLQYHTLFSRLAAGMIRLGILAQGFALLYAALLIAFHIAWRGIVRCLGGSEGAYLLSVVLYYLAAAGTGLGMYQFFQDSSLLPSNIANVAMLWCIWLWLIRRPIAAGAALGLAGVFHLNHALVGIPLWIGLCFARRSELSRRSTILGTLFAIGPSAANIAFAAHLKLSRSGVMPLEEFINLYVRLRHPHHYDPSTWPVGIWLAFIAPAVAGLFLLKGAARGIVALFCGLILIALSGAGIWYVSETLVQMSLYRYSIYVQLMGCIALGVWCFARGNAAQARIWTWTSAVCCLSMVGVGMVRGPFFGLFVMPRDDAEYVQLCQWVERNTPVDATFLVPPDEQSMRLIGRRAIIVNFKAVPQLSGELSQWRGRMSDVLHLPDLTSLPRRYDLALAEMRGKYDARTAPELISTAGRYGARYIVATRQLMDESGELRQIGSVGRYIVYDLDRGRRGSDP